MFVEVNLGEIVSQKDLGEYDHTNVMDMKCIGRVLVYGEKGLGMFLMRFWVMWHEDREKIIGEWENKDKLLSGFWYFFSKSANKSFFKIFYEWT